MFAYLLHALTLAITVVVVAVPEGLPMMITVVLSSNMSRMLKDHVLVRKLVGIETSGSLNILFTDKTGTLTGASCSVAQICRRAGQGISGADSLRTGRPRLCATWLQLSCLYNTRPAPSPQDGRWAATQPTAPCCSTLSALTPARLPDTGWKRSVPFDSANKFSAVSWPSGDQPDALSVKGAPEKLLARLHLRIR